MACKDLKTYAGELYINAGEQEEDISVDKYGHLLVDKVAQTLQIVLEENPLPFELQDFQKLTLHALVSGENVILISPTGSGKMIVAFLAIKLLQKLNNIPNGVGVGTQPLSSIMEEKLQNSYVRTGVISMKGGLKTCNVDELELSEPLEDFKTGRIPCLLGHAESWISPVAQDILENLHKNGLVLFSFVDEAHITLTDHCDRFRPHLKLVPGELRAKTIRGAPCLAMTATLTPVEITELKKNLGLRSNVVVLQANPIQDHYKFVQ